MNTPLTSMEPKMNAYAALYEQARLDAEFLMEVGVEPTSAYKQAASDLGIPYGEPMGDFVAWATGS